MDNRLARESLQLRVQKIDKIGPAIEVQVDRAEKITKPTRREFQMRLNRA